ncbi:MAG: hypothetical protein H6582_02725 [Crocinitomicaceae bacterium]|nr:hypothetical protein [Crocinitomicaceae bacterium]
MKTIIKITFILLASVSFGQIPKGNVNRKMIAKDVVVQKEPVLMSKDANLTYGDFEVSSFETISNKSLNKKDLQHLLGTLIRIRETDITGDLIDPLTIENIGTEKMNREDYIFRAFGSTTLDTESNLPEIVNVHKTGRSDCYGIVILSNSKVVMPYKGTLLFLDLK